MKIPVEQMEVIITSDNRVVSRCALGQREESLFPQTSVGELHERMIARFEAEREFAFVEGDGTLIKVEMRDPCEVAMANHLLDRIGSDRRWMEVQEIDSSEEE